MPKARGKTPGWAAVDLKLRHGGGPDLESDPYPPVQNAIASLRPCRNLTRFEQLSADSCKGFEQFFNDVIASIKNGLEHLKLILSKPEREEDDVYLSHRKDAIKLMRSAAQHSRMASSAFLKRDHYSAQQHSSRAREDRLTANNLHAKAAKEILSINNNKNDMWKLDLHGLHAIEAVKALQNHLMMIETQSSSHRSIYPKRVTGVSTRQRPTTLQVITGRGIHSKGHAVLPAAVRGFLDENGYGYDGTRPGVINVRPKFRRGKSVPK